MAVAGEQIAGRTGAVPAARLAVLLDRAVELVRGALVAALVLLIGALPLVTLIVPSLADDPVLGLPLAIVLVVAALVAFAAVAWLYGQRRPDAPEPRSGGVQARLVR
ncbi:hypothetical protein [Patulibacter defluvii]|uniref:hypothetical protein n=1 Tax=Patulibacter defluvii TaxID=3095358 RepID=UPI002A750524|nr:hypothetical protein [Patulibacter sp. DM4]